jgi:hypothetical protein
VVTSNSRASTTWPSNWVNGELSPPPTLKRT